MRQNKSRLSRHIEGQRKKQTIFFAIIIIAILALLLRFAPVILDGIGVIALQVNQDDGAEPTKTIEIVIPPSLKADFTATDTARMTVRGDAFSDEGTVELFVNDELQIEHELEKAEFEIEDVKLTEGENIIKARTIIDKNTSEFSRDLIILYIKEEVKIEEMGPSDGQEFKKGDQEIEVSGKTNPSNKVTVNGFRAIVDQNGRFSYMLRLKDGDNEIKVEAISPTGKKAEKTVRVKYSP